MLLTFCVKWIVKNYSNLGLFRMMFSCFNLVFVCICKNLFDVYLFHIWLSPPFLMSLLIKTKAFNCNDMIL